MRHALTVLLAAGLTCHAESSRADHCHTPVPLSENEHGVSVSLSAEAASYRTVRYEGTYEGLAFGVGYARREFRVRALLPAYRLIRNGLPTRGFGDFFVQAQLPIFRPASEPWVFGLGAGATLPTGNANEDLGMGHVMLMPGAWAEWTPEPLFARAQLSYGRALLSGGSDAHHHRGGARPIVSPMNTSEVEGEIALGCRLFDPIRARGGLYGALRAGGEDGSSRAVAYIGVDATRGQFEAGVEGHVPVLGDPFSAKLMLTTGARF